MVYNSDVVVKKCKPRSINSNDLLGYGNFREIATTCANMEIIEDLLCLLMGKTLVKDDGVHC